MSVRIVWSILKLYSFDIYLLLLRLRYDCIFCVLFYTYGTNCVPLSVNLSLLVWSRFHAVTSYEDCFFFFFFLVSLYRWCPFTKHFQVGLINISHSTWKMINTTISELYLKTKVPSPKHVRPKLIFSYAV